MLIQATVHAFFKATIDNRFLFLLLVLHDNTCIYIYSDISIRMGGKRVLSTQGIYYLKCLDLVFGFIPVGLASLAELNCNIFYPVKEFHRLFLLFKQA